MNLHNLIITVFTFINGSLILFVALRALPWINGVLYLWLVRFIITNYYPITPSYQAYNKRLNTSSSYMGSGMTYYSGDISGTSQRIGPFTYHNLNSGLRGTSQDIGNVTYHNFNSGLSGTSQRIGNFRYHNFNSGASGATQSIGNFDYINFSDGTHCTTQYIGNTAYTNCN